MDPQAAGELVEHWLLAGAGSARDHGPVSRSVRALAPDSPHTGVGDTGLGPAMVVLDGDALLVLEVRRTQPDEPPTVVAHRLKLDGDVQFVLEERYEQLDGATVRQRVWKLDGGGVALRVRGAEPMSGAGPDGNERLARAIAAALGWHLP
jgi:hypothetical protein